MHLTDSLFAVIKKTFNYSDRSSRFEYWSFNLLNLAIVLLLMMVDYSNAALADDPQKILLSDIYALIILLPSLSLQARRLHDVGHSGWWQLISITGIGFIVILYWSILAGDEGDNKYGHAPHH